MQCWGDNSNGQLGDGTKTSRSTPVAVMGLASGVAAVAAGGGHTCAVTTPGGVVCWGDNVFGQLGDGTTTDRSTFVPVAGLASGVVAVTAGRLHTCALTSAGAVHCWGDNSDRQLGDGTSTSRSTPVAVMGLASGVAAVAAGQYHTCAVTTPGGVMCWGDNTLGQVGDGTANPGWSPVPVRVVGFGSDMWSFFAEGATSGSFGTRIAVVNPGGVTANALLSFQRNDGTIFKQLIAVPARTRRTLDVQGVVGMSQAEFATAVASSQPLVVDRTMTWGDPTHGVYGSHAERSVASPATTWYLAEGATHSGFELFYLLQNPNAADAQVRVRYLRPSDPPLEKTYTLPPTSRTNIWVNLEEFTGLGTALASTDVSAVIEVTNGQPIIVERAMYLDGPGQPFGAGHESAGVTAPATEWFLAEGATGRFFDLFVLVANPNDSDANVEATYLLPDGGTVVKRYSVAANSRFNIWVDHEDARLADTAVSTTIRSTNTVPVIVERAMWWPDGGWYEAHNSSGATTTGTRWALAEGEVDASRSLETYILVANTSAIPADVKVTLLFEDGTSTEQTYTDVPAKSRFNVPVGGFFPQAAGRRFGAIVESLGATPAQIVVERAMYWDALGQRWAAGTNALATKLQ